ncbi:hypothetical protein CCACVL1_20448 [Corchorus capsularis]|uniref:Uncharacterized protein n=1 Tax=Corchorus capsularis TaxID=210143 RepID=A0A1R3HB42_COCAP|nr:hypothetical protein CCACVL1_20448 [Corchorus capsularis]
MPAKNFPPRRGQIKIKIIKGILKSAAKILSTGAELRMKRGVKGGGLSSSSTTPGVATPNGYNSDGSLN